MAEDSSVIQYCDLHLTISRTPVGYLAYDERFYDGAPDSGSRILGYGATPEEAAADYYEQMEDEG